MSETRVLIVDDSPVVRSTFADAIALVDGLEVAGFASNGEEARQRVAALRPDVITMDVRMPGMDGLEAIEWIMSEHPTPILVVSDASTSQPGLAFEALRRGALEVVAKPEALLENPTARARFAEKLLLLAGVRVVRHRAPRPQSPVPTPRCARNLEVVGFVSSTGGPPVVAEILGALPADARLTVLIVQHLPEGFAERFAYWLDRVVAPPVRVAEAGGRVRPGIFVAPVGSHLRLSAAWTFSLESPTDPQELCPSGDVLLESIAQNCGARGCGVVLSGMGEDGARGLARIHGHGGLALVQAPETAVVGSMPRAALARSNGGEAQTPRALARTLRAGCR